MHDYNYPLSCRGCEVLDSLSKENSLFIYNNECLIPGHLRQSCPCPKCVEKKCPISDGYGIKYPCKKFRELQEMFVRSCGSAPVYDDIH